jgi:hypothetical protein
LERKIADRLRSNLYCSTLIGYRSESYPWSFGFAQDKPLSVSSEQAILEVTE